MKSHAYSRFLGLLAFALCSLAPLAARAGIGRPVEFCSSSATCSGCQVCVNNTCQLEAPPLCRCDAECEIYGFTACELSHPDRPLCGGACTKPGAASGLVCGQGDDAWTLEDAPAPIEAVASGALVSSDQLEVTVAAPHEGTSSVSKVDGCSLVPNGSRELELWPLFVAFGLFWRRR